MKISSNSVWKIIREMKHDEHAQNEPYVHEYRQGYNNGWNDCLNEIIHNLNLTREIKIAPEE
jgi:hypothetical protein